LRRGKLLAAWRGAVVVMSLLSLCTAGQEISPPPASAQTCTGLPSLAASFNSIGITADDNTTPSDNLGFDGNRATFSQAALVQAGAAPGALIRSSGVTFTFPNVAAGTLDNTFVLGQTICMSGSGTLGFLISADNGPIPNSAHPEATPVPGTITYTDGSTQSYELSSPDWFSTTPLTDEALAISSAYQNRPDNTTYNGTGNIFSMTVALTPGKTVLSVTLPAGLSLAVDVPVMHVFAIATTNATLLSQGRPATASSEESASFPASAAVDGDLETRWSSEPGVDPEWLQVDLGYVATISHVVLYWETAFSTHFQIQTSTDDTNWTTIYSITDWTGPTFTSRPIGMIGEQILNVTGSGRYVRMFAIARATQYGDSLWEFQVYGAAPTPVLSPDVSVGYSHACAIVAAQPYCWGNNEYGELGTGSNTPSLSTTAVGATALSTTPSQITAGNYYTCMLNTSSEAYCLGRNDYGELGGTGNPVLTPTGPVTGNYSQVSASYNGNHSCALNDSNEAYCWGRNNYGQLASTTAGGPTPVAVTVLNVNTPNTPPPATPVSPSPVTPTFTRISAGTDNTCAVATTGFAYCWGNNSDGKLGCSTVINPTCPSTSTNVPVAVDTSGVLTDKTVTEITAGDTHTCALDSDGNAYCWGSNADGQLGCGTVCGDSSNVPVLVSAPQDTRWAQITAGSSFTCALTTDGKAYCWGLGSGGQLGAGTSATSSLVPVAVSTGTGTGLPDGTVLTQISSGYASTCVMDEASNVYCWGLNDNGQLGNGSQVSSFVPVKVRGLVPGELSITVPDTATLSSATPGGTASGQLGEVTVTDDRATGAGTWVVSVSMTDFTSGVAPAPVYTIPATAVTYTIAGPPDAFTGVDGTSPVNHARPPGVTFGAAAAPPALPGNDVEVVTGSGTYAVTWDPAISVAVPRTAVAGTYTATITHSVT
jgi:alpha-tubulin suppressor-like RCC1 family protein